MSYSPYPSLWDRNWLDRELDNIRNENLTGIVIRRDDTRNVESVNLPDQFVRIARLGSSDRVERAGATTKDVHMQVTILGDETLDIMPEDRFQYQGRLFRVVSVAPHDNGLNGVTTRVRAHGELVS